MAASMSNTTVPTSSVADSKGPMTWDDATWILTSAFIIFTMQSGFGMLEAGAVASKNTVNIMVKNVVDVVFGGMTYWMFGYALSFGDGPYSNPFCGMGDFFVDTNSEEMGLIYATFVFQLSFATTATTIVSGAMAERTRLTAYIVFSFFNTIVYCVPAHWAWGDNGFLATLGAVDFAGSGVVHLVGASSGLVATLMLKPRLGRYSRGRHPDTYPALVNPVNAIVGTFMLWWGWLAFNCGSTFGISGGKWKLASKAAFTTLISSMAGGITGIAASYIVHTSRYDVGYLINSILGSLVSITASCPLVRPYEAVVVGVVGALCTLGWSWVMDRLQVDDPVSAVAVHGAAGMWGLVAVGLFVEDDNVEDLTSDRNGLFKGGGFYLLGVQLLSIVCEVFWAVLTTFIILYVIDRTLGLRVSAEEERIGADFLEHGITEPASKTSSHHHHHYHHHVHHHPSPSSPTSTMGDSGFSLDELEWPTTPAVTAVAGGGRGHAKLTRLASSTSLISAHDLHAQHHQQQQQRQQNHHRHYHLQQQQQQPEGQLLHQRTGAFLITTPWAREKEVKVKRNGVKVKEGGCSRSPSTGGAVGKGGRPRLHLHGRGRRRQVRQEEGEGGGVYRGWDGWSGVVPHSVLPL